MKAETKAGKPGTNPGLARTLRAIGWTGAALLRFRYDLMGLAGLAVFVRGIAMVSRPAAWIIGGAVAIAVAILAEAGSMRLRWIEQARKLEQERAQ